MPNLRLGLGLKRLGIVAVWLAILIAQLTAFPVVTQASPQDGAVDLTFKSGAGFNDEVRATALQPDGKLLVGGSFKTYNQSSQNGLVRLNSDGSLDSGFTAVLGPYTDWDNIVYSLLVQPDGKILVGGSFLSKSLVRLNSDGSPDSGFTAQFPQNVASRVFSLALQPDGKILAGGGFSTTDGETYTGSWRGVTRFNSDGTADSSFTPVSGVSGASGAKVQTIALQPDGKIVIGGDFTNYDGVAQSGLVRLNSNGTLDTSLNYALQGAYSYMNNIYAIRLQPDGKILVGGYSSPNNYTRYVFRLNSDGSLDNTFTQPPTGDVYGTAYALVLQTDGKILVGLEGKPFRNNGIPQYSATRRILRLNSDGTLDSNFKTAAGEGANATVRTIALQTDGKVVFGGLFNKYDQTARNHLARLNSDGTLDTSYGSSNTGTEGFIGRIFPQTSGKIFIVGPFNEYSGYRQTGLVRLNSDGTPDTTFVVASNTAWGTLALATQADGKILLGGGFGSETPGDLRSIVKRLNTDGSVDSSFTPDSSFYDSHHAISSLIVLPDGKILIAEYFTGTFGISTIRYRVLRLNSDGSIDTTFNSGGVGVNHRVYSMALQSDGKIIIGGDFSSYNGTSTNKIARLNSDGSLDSSFTMSYSMLADSWVNQLKLQSNGKILANLQFSSSSNPNKLVRLNSDGSLDSSFAYSWNPGVELGNTIADLALQSDGKVLITGSLDFYNGTLLKGVARLNLDGSVDSTFDPGTGPNQTSSTGAIAIQADGRILVGGIFSAFNGVSAGSLVRLKLAETGPVQELEVSSNTDDGTGTQAGTLSFALAQATDGTTIVFNFPAGSSNEIVFSGNSSLNVKPGVSINGGANGLVLNGNGSQAGGLVLAGNNRLTNITLKNFKGQEIASSSSSAGQNYLYLVRVVNS